MGLDGTTISGRDGIAEAFEEFARKEGLSFFQDAPSIKAA
jgi:type I restriction enzyme M protein